LPILGRLFAHSHTDTNQTDIILTLTPHIIRVLDVNDSDLRAFRVGRDSIAPLNELPPPVEMPRPVEAPAPAPAQAPLPPGQVPIQPPAVPAPAAAPGR
jgi:general secretion pathway protein D